MQAGSSGSDRPRVCSRRNRNRSGSLRATACRAGAGERWSSRARARSQSASQRTSGVGAHEIFSGEVVLEVGGA